MRMETVDEVTGATVQDFIDAAHRRVQLTAHEDTTDLAPGPFRGLSVAGQVKSGQ
jgi:hypothetical protein